MSFLTKIFGDPNIKAIKELEPIISRINNHEDALKALSLDNLKNKTQEFKNRLANGETLEEILPEAFAVVREMSYRLTGMRHFDVQMMGGIILHRGQISEMRTGEGKTLVATLPVYLNALTGRGTHVVTVNDYLAKRDAVWMGQIYHALGLSVGVIQQQSVSFKYNPERLTVEGQKNADTQEGGSLDAERDVKGSYKVEYEFLEVCDRKTAYACDITYGTNNEFGFDYLRDNMAPSLEEMVQRPFYYAIVDEVDSILIDEARTPLIISAPAEEAADMYYKFADVVNTLEENVDYNVDEKMRSSTLTEAGMQKVERAAGVENIYSADGTNLVHHVEQALRAKALFKKDRDYVVEGGEVIIVDEFTGRKMPGRRYSEGLHQAIEAKEKVKIQRESRTMATITFQNYFRLYEKLAGMTGTAVTEAEEFGKIYKLEVIVVPTNKQNKRVDHPDRIYRTEEAKYKAIAQAVKDLQKKGQPVLIGTISVEKNEELSLFLEREGVNHEILNAKNHEREGEIIAQAGRAGAVTLATNMAGRGVDIILGGNPPNKEKAEQVRTAGGLFVIGTERHESRRIDNQLRGRSARQGDPGETQFYLSTQDDLMRIFAGDRIRAVMQTLRVPDDMPIENRSITKIIESAQKKVEGFHFDTRKHLLDYDDVLNRHREVVYGRRRQVLDIFNKQKNGELKEGDKNLKDLVLEMVENEIEQLVSFHTNTEDKKDWDMKEIAESANTIFILTDEEEKYILNLGEHGEEKKEAVAERTRIVEYLVGIAKEKYERIFTSTTESGKTDDEIEKHVLLHAIDSLWIDHLVAIDYLRTGIGLRGYGQRDPLVEYKKETYRMFNELLSAIQSEVAHTVYKIGAGLKLMSKTANKSRLVYSGSESVNAQTKIKDEHGEKVGRNDKCPCGSGKKFKKCHGV
jgi:preprotein translocase subunit SecA